MSSSSGLTYSGQCSWLVTMPSVSMSSPANGNKIRAHASNPCGAVMLTSKERARSLDLIQADVVGFRFNV